MRRIVLGRQEVYREVWDRPIRKVAESYGISDVGLAKICRRLDIPTPLRGHWAKLDAGQDLKVPPLPPASDGVAEYVEARIPHRGPVVDLIPEPAVDVSKQIRNPHPLVRLTREDLKGASPDDYGRLWCRDPQGLDIRVSKNQLSRALRIAEALIRCLEQLGSSVEVGVGWSRKFETSAVIDGEKVQFSIREPSLRRKQPKDDSKWSYDRYTYDPSGRLELKIEEYVTTGATKTVRDRSSTRSIEKGLGKFVVGLHACAQVMKIKRKEREEEGRRREDARLVRERQARRAAYRIWLRDELLSHATAHRDARMIREFLVSLAENDDGTKKVQYDREWISWANEEADRLDPVTNEDGVALPLDPPEDWHPDGNSQWRDTIGMSSAWTNPRSLS